MPAVVTKRVSMDCGPKYVKADMAKAMIGGLKKGLGESKNTWFRWHSGEG